MIPVDTSALMAVVLGEGRSDACVAALATEDDLLISAVTVAEALIVARSRNVLAEMTSLLDGLGFEVEPVTAGTSRRVAEIYRRWGKGIHPAGLNFGDCFAYDLAHQHGCPLLYVGDGFARTDLASAL